MKVELNSKRIKLLALTLEELICLDKNKNIDNLEINNELLLDTNFSRAIKIKINKMKNTMRVNHTWYTYWLILEKTQNQGIGFIGFKGYPVGATSEIGYGLCSKYSKDGYMNESIALLINWAKQNEDLQYITATHVDKNNIASQNLLLKNNFKLKKRVLIQMIMYYF